MAGITKAVAATRLLPGGTNRSNIFLFDVVEELPNPKIEIPFDGNPIFDGNPDDLNEFKEEMWKRSCLTPLHTERSTAPPRATSGATGWKGAS